MVEKSKIQLIISQKLDELEAALKAQEHIHTSDLFISKLRTLSKYFHLMSDEDRHCYNAAKDACEDKVEWQV